MAIFQSINANDGARLDVNTLIDGCRHLLSPTKKLWVLEPKAECCLVYTGNREESDKFVHIHDY